MSNLQPPTADDIEQLMLNARLRDELEPSCDESFELLANHRLPTREENEFLASMLAWERAPVLPISKWFDPELVLPRPESLGDRDLHRILWDTLNKLYDKRVVLDFTDHLSDRQLYCLILRDILPSRAFQEQLRGELHGWVSAESLEGASADAAGDRTPVRRAQHTFERANITKVWA